MSEPSGHAASRFRSGVILGALLSCVASGACSDNAPALALDTVDREIFIAVYVDLRRVALRKTSRKPNATERDSVLALHEVVEEDLRIFLEVYHTDEEYMRDLWNEVEARISLMLEMAGEESDGDG